MPRDDGYTRYVEAGTAFLNMTQQRAEALVKDLVRSGEVRKERAQAAIADLMDRGRRSTEDLRMFIRREIADQMTTLGMATKDDLARVEAKLDAVLAARAREEATRSKTPATKAASVAKAAPPAKADTKGAPITKAARAKRPPASATKKAPPPVEKATTGRAPSAKKGPGPISRPGARARPPASGSS